MIAGTRKFCEDGGLRIVPGSNGWGKAGHLGAWYSVLNALEWGGPFLALDDDVAIHPKFELVFDKCLYELPEDADFLSLYIAPIIITNKVKPVTEHLSRVYTPYGGAAIWWTQQGIEKFMELVKRDGMFTQYDNQLYNYSWTGEMNGYMPLPTVPRAVYTRNMPSTIQETQDIF